ncbi:Peptide chain release factor [Fusarium oxysporum f. sp. vasinfectum]|nr:Peptide chain release factor [Fusarium oxysporum f. sp. vasinfectum]
MAVDTSDSVCPTLRDEPLSDEKPQDDAASTPSQGDEEIQACTLEDPDEPPDGGLQAWLQVVTGHLVAFNSWGYLISFGIFQPYYESQFSLPPSTISWIGSLEVCLIFFIGTFSGRAFDAGYYRTALAVGLFLQVLAIFMTSIASSYWQVLLAQGICQGLGNGIIFAPTIANMSTYFTTKKTIAISAGACGAGTGGIVFPLIAQQLLPKIGFRWTVRVMGLVVAVSSMIIMIIAKTRLKARKAGPLVEWAAFKEPAYVLFAAAMFFTLWPTWISYNYHVPNTMDMPNLHKSINTLSHAPIHASPLLAPALLQRAQSLTTEHDDLQKTLNNSFDSTIAKRVGELSRVAEALKAWQTSQASVAELTSMLNDPDQDADLAAIARDELSSETGKLESLARRLSASLTPRHPFADFPCMLEFRPGPGGLEGRYFMDTLFKMYKALCMRRGYRHTVVKYEFADTAGDSSSSAGENPLQEAILEVHDQGAFDIFRSEAGMHRVQRIPSTETKGRVHTSAVAVWVLPSFPENGAANIDFDDPESDFYVNPQEVKIETMRARGAGGQHVNKTESAIRMTHLPTGTTVSMQDHRSQQRNREEAWKLLRSRIADQRREAREEEASKLRNSVLSKTQITRGDKIRTYNYNQDRCTDHRAGVDVHDLPNVLEGGEKLDRIMDGAKDWLVNKDIELLMAEEEAKEKLNGKK